MLARVNRRNVINDPHADPGRLGDRFHDVDSGHVVTYRIKRLPLALSASFIAGNLSSLLGIGGGVIKVPVLNAWCGMPLRAAAATSAMMIGVTATSGAIIYYGHGNLQPLAAAPAVLGVQFGSWARPATRGARVGEMVEAAHGGDPRHRRGFDVCPEPAVKADDRGLIGLELTIGRVLRLGVGASSVLLAAGLLLTLAHEADGLAPIVLTAAIVILLATPAARVVISVAEYVRERDWLFAALTSIVLLTLAGSVVVAFWSRG